MTNLTVSKICIAVGLYLLASTASAYDVQIDTFTVTKNANPVPVVLDPFDDNAPPSERAEGHNHPPTVTYGVNGTFAEASGVATMTTATGNSTVFGGTNFIQHNAILLTNTQPLTTSTNGLKSDDTFSASGLFNVSIPTANRESYGVYFTDRLGVGGSVNTGDDQLEMRMVRDAMGDLRIQFQRVDWTTQTSTGIQSILLSTAVGTAFNDTTNDQLLLRLDNNLNIDGTSFVTASYEYFDNGSSLSNGLLSFSNTASIFNGEDYTRAAFFARVAQPVAAVPEPEIYAMMGLGLGLIGWIGRRKKLKEAAAA